MPGSGAPAPQQGEELFRAIYEHAAVGIAQVSLDGRLLMVNPAMQRMLGRPAGDVPGHTYSEFTHPDDRATEAALIESVRQGERNSYQLDKRVLHSDGSYLWVTLSSSLVRDSSGTPLYRIATLQDITERKRAEEELRASEHRFRLALKNAPVSVALQDRDLIYRWAYNQRTRDPNEILGKTDAELFAPEDLPSILNAKRRVLDSGTEVHLQHWVTSNGRRLFLDLYYEPTRDASGEINGVGIAVVDLTTRKLAEDALGAKRAQLQAALASMTDSVFISDEGGRFLEFNNAFARFYKFRSKDECAKSITEFQALLDVFLPSGESAPLEMWAVPRALRGETVTNAEYTLRRKDTGETWVGSYSFAPIRNDQGRIVGTVVAARDVTEQKRAEARLRRFYQTDLFAVLYWSIEGGVIDVNDRFLQMTGYTRQDLHSGLLNWAQMTPPEFHHLDEEARRQIRETGVHLPYEKQFFRKDGTRVWGEFSAAAWEDNPNEGISFILDITERKQAEEALRISETRYKLLTESITDPFFATDRDLRFTYWNRHTEELTGVSAAAALGKTRSELFGDNDSTRRADSISRECLRTRQPMHYEIVWDFPAGRRSFDARVFPSDDGLVIISRDITEAKRTEEALRLANNRFEVALRDSPVVVFNQDLDLRYTWIYNPALGYNAQDVHGKRDIDIFERISDGEITEALKREVIRTGVSRSKEVLIHWQGVDRFYDLMVDPLRDLDGHIVGVTCAAVDITERKQAEQALLRSEKLASVGRMAAAIAHEINNPLGAVTNLLYLAKMNAAMPESARQYLEMADAELKRIAHLTRQSLGFYRESAGPTLTSVQSVLESALEMLQSKIRAKGAVIERQLEDDITIIAVPGELRQVFSNLLANSLDAIDLGGTIRLRISRVQSSPAVVRVLIADNGRGIGANARNHIFEPFFTTKGSVGTGLGLWVARQIVDKHKGTIRMRSVTSGERHGTVFSVSLPAERPVAEKLATDVGQAPEATLT